MASLSCLQAVTQLRTRHRHSSSLSSVSSSGFAHFSPCQQNHGLPPPPVRAVRVFIPARAAFPAIANGVAVTAQGTEVPTVAATKRAFLETYRRPIPSIYSTVIQELLVQQHLMRYNATYRYDAVFGLGFVTLFDQLFDGYPSVDDREAIFNAYVHSLKENPDQYRTDSKNLEEWARKQSATSIMSFGDGEVDALLKDISERAGGKGDFHYSRFFAIGLFRIMELAKASEPVILEQICQSLNVKKLSVERDLDVYRNLLSKLAQAKDLSREYLDREKRKQAEKAAAKLATKSEVKTEAKSE